MKIKFLTVICLSVTVFHCTGQNTNIAKMTTDSTNNNPLICDPIEGVCGISENNQTVTITTRKSEKPVKVIYFTDPICSSCWGIEPQLRKLKLEYGDDIEIDYRMGGLLRDWSYNSGGISKPSDVAHHWDEVSLHYEMPIDGDVWLEDPLDSSYPPSIAFKAAQIQNKEKAVLLMREMREMLFLNKKNIAKWEHIATAAERVGLNVEQLKNDFEGRGKILFEEDLKLAKENGVRGFPSIFFINDSGNKEMIYGTKPYIFYETAVLKMFPNARKNEYSKNWEFLFEKYPSLTAKEFAELSGLKKMESEKILDDLFMKGKLQKLTTKNGSLWTVKATEE